MTPLPVTFFYPYPDEIARLEDLDLHDHAFWSHEGKERRRAWVLQTYLWLRRYGHEVDISDTLPPDGTVVVLPEPYIREALLRQYSAAHRELIIVTIRADVYDFRPLLGDVDVTQNGRFADDRRTFFVPHWPQPGLIPRDPSRGTTIENVVFKGGFGSLDQDFRSAQWYDELAKRNLRFHIATARTEGDVPNWHDYGHADLNLAVRPSFDDGGMRCEKPASKLVNAWHAGVPSLLGREYAFRELRRSELDYIEVTTVDEALSAIDRLIADPELYQRMIQRAHDRAQAFTPARIAERWSEVLFDAIPDLAHRSTFRWSRKLPLRARQLVNLVCVPPTPFELRKQMGHLYRRAKSHLHLTPA